MVSAGFAGAEPTRVSAASRTSPDRLRRGRGGARTALSRTPRLGGARAPARRAGVRRPPRERPHVVALAVGRLAPSRPGRVVRHGRRRSGGGRGRADRRRPRPGCVEICRAWARCRHVAGVLYVAAPAAFAPVGRAIGAAGAEGRIALLALEALEERPPRRIPSQAPRSLGEGVTATTGKDQPMPSFNVNRVVLIGRLTRDPELRSTTSGTCVASLRLACNSSRKDADGEYQERPNYFDVSVFGNTAENVEHYLSKGSRVAVDGRLEWREWETTEQQKRQAVSIIADVVQFLDSPGRARGGAGRRRVLRRGGRAGLLAGAGSTAAGQERAGRGRGRPNRLAPAAPGVPARRPPSIDNARQHHSHRQEL